MVHVVCLHWRATGDMACFLMSRCAYSALRKTSSVPSVAQDWLVAFEEQFDRLFRAGEVVVVAGPEIVEQRRQGRRAQGYGMA